MQGESRRGDELRAKHRVQCCVQLHDARFCAGRIDKAPVEVQRPKVERLEVEHLEVEHLEVERLWDTTNC